MSGDSQNSFDRKRFHEGELILRQGELGGRAYLVESGSVEIARRRGDGKRVLARVGPGGIFGELALIDGQVRLADARALSETVCLIVPGDLFRDKLDRADPFLRALLRIMARNVRSLTMELVDGQE